jgi:two-component system, cell cycle sensor histidine kinase and response regulator CckA
LLKSLVGENVGQTALDFQESGPMNQPCSARGPKRESLRSRGALPEAGGLPLEELLDTLPDALVCLDQDRKVLFQNAPARCLFGEAADAPPGHPIPARIKLAELLDQLKLPSGAEAPGMAGPVRLLETRRTDGAAVTWEVSCVNRRVGKRPVWVVAVREASHVPQIQDAIYQTQKRQVVGSLAAGIAHDFNNILTAVIANIDLALLDEALPPGTREYLERAQRSGRRGAELNAKLLAFSRHSETQPAVLDLTKVTEEALFILRRSLEKRIDIVFQPSAGLWLAQADENQIVQVLMNLCLNARDAMPQGGTLTISLANLAFRAEAALPPRRAGEFVRLTVSDTGAGLSPETMQRLFEPYYTTKEYGKGAGLNLCIAGHVLAEHGGWMEVESQPGRGSQFHMFLPRSASGVPVVAAGSISAPTPQAEPKGGTETILVVDDEPAVRSVVKAILQYRGYKVLEAANGEEGLQVLQRGPGSVGLVLLDINMPGLGGWETLARMRELSPRTPVLMLSGSPDKAGHAIADPGAAGVLAKPFKNLEMVRVVRATLDGMRAD